MNLTITPARSPRPTFPGPATLWHEALRRERTLMVMAAALLLAMLPAAIALGLDERTLRGVSVWVKPLKFMASFALFAASTAWFIGLLPEARRASRPVRIIVWTVAIAGLLEVGYITWQAAFGQASHYNFSDALHIALYNTMGALAVAMMLTQPVLAWHIARHGRPELDPTWRAAVVLGLVMTFVLGVGAAMPLASAQPPAGAGAWLFGWHFGGGDLRPAHFVGSHAQQFVPLAGWMLMHAGLARPRVALAAFAIGYTALWLAAMQLGLRGVVWTVPA
jgi:hypothetical protein